MTADPRKARIWDRQVVPLKRSKWGLSNGTSCTGLMLKVRPIQLGLDGWRGRKKDEEKEKRVVPVGTWTLLAGTESPFDLEETCKRRGKYLFF